jgi:luciferase family oxidoreductase group 1
MPVVPRIPLSVLDIAPVATGSTPAQALGATTELARHVERLGYRRYWLAEHHNLAYIAACTPPVLVGHVASATSRLVVGAGGVMLPNHQPLVVAEQFGTLAALHPGRIDLGIGRAPGTDPITAMALRRSPQSLSDSDFPRQIAELMRYFDAAADDPISAVPAAGNRPPIWILGSSGYSAMLAARIGAPYAFANHLAAGDPRTAVDLYRKNFVPSPHLGRPQVIVSVMAIAAETDEKARWIASSMGLLALLQRTGDQRILLPSPEEAAARAYTADERAFVDGRIAAHWIGGPGTIESKAAELLADTPVDEIMAFTLAHSLSDRMRSYELLAEIFGLTPEPDDGPSA